MFSSRKLGSLAIDLLCMGSLAGIWPRYIEPKRLKKTYLSFSFGKNLKIIQLSDLHCHEGTSERYLKKVLRSVNEERPDLLLFTGDFLCYSKLEKKEVLKHFLSEMYAPLGKFCIFGNHDYASYVSRTLKGDYEILKPAHPLGGLIRGVKSLFSKNVVGKISEETKKVSFHEELMDLLRKSDFTLLENRTITLPIGLNIVGLGDYALGRFHPELAFKNYCKEYPGIVLSHNPDTIEALKNYPGEIILAGHTHGEQIHFPYPPFLRKLSQKLTRLENTIFTRGLYTLGNKKIYVNRGIGCHKPIRFLSPPEILVMEMK